MRFQQTFLVVSLFFYVVNSTARDSLQTSAVPDCLSHHDATVTEQNASGTASNGDVTSDVLCSSQREGEADGARRACTFTRTVAGEMARQLTCDCCSEEVPSWRTDVSVQGVMTVELCFISCFENAIESATFLTKCEAGLLSESVVLLHAQECCDLCIGKWDHAERQCKGAGPPKRPSPKPSTS